MRCKDERQLRRDIDSRAHEFLKQLRSHIDGLLDVGAEIAVPLSTGTNGNNCASIRPAGLKAAELFTKEQDSYIAALEETGTGPSIRIKRVNGVPAPDLIEGILNEIEDRLRVEDLSPAGQVIPVQDRSRIREAIGAFNERFADRGGLAVVANTGDGIWLVNVPRPR